MRVLSSEDTPQWHYNKKSTSDSEFKEHWRPKTAAQTFQSQHIIIEGQPKWEMSLLL